MYKCLKFMDKLPMRELHKSRLSPRAVHCMCLSQLKSVPNNTPLFTADPH